MNPFVEKVMGVDVPTGGVALFWLEQSHFLIKTHYNKFVHVDPFLSRDVKPENHIHPQPLVSPEEAPAHLVFMTHDHRDHTDPHTLGPLAKAEPDCRFVGPPESCARCRDEIGIDPGRLIETHVGDKQEIEGVAFETVHAENTGSDDATTHLGYILRIDGRTIYHAGDTRCDPDQYLSKMEPVKALQPDAMMIAINEKYNNPGPDGARRLVEWADPKMAIPCHYDCFKNNTIDPRRFVDALPPALRPRARVMTCGEGLLLSSSAR